MECQSERWEARREGIGDRIAAIRARLDELRRAQRGNKDPVTSSGQFVEAQHYAAISEAAAQRALAASIGAFLRAAEAHERAAVQHEHMAVSGDSRQAQHRERAAFHRAAAATDRQRASTTQLLFAGQRPELRRLRGGKRPDQAGRAYT